jgi:hypothetical protein
LSSRLRHHPVPYRHDEARVLRHRDELAGRYIAELRIAPSDQGLGANHLARGQIDLRLVLQAESVACQRLAHRMVQPHALTQVGVMMRLVEAETAAATLLGTLHGRLGVTHQRVLVFAVDRKHCNAHAAGQRELKALHGAGPGDGVEHPPRSTLRAAAVDALHQQRELVAANARHLVALAQAGLQPLGGVLQHAVADFVAKTIVDLLEPVQVQYQQRQRLALLPGLPDRLDDHTTQLAPVVQAGQHVGRAELADALAGAFQRGEVTVGPDPATRAALVALRLSDALEQLPRQQHDALRRPQERGLAHVRHPALVAFGVDDAAPHPVGHGAVVALDQQRFRHAPHLRKSPIEGRDASGEVGHQDAVGGRLERGLQLGQQRFAFLLLLLLGRAIAYGHQQVGGGAARPDGADAARDMQQMARRIDEHRVGRQAGVAAGTHIVPIGEVFWRGNRQAGADALQPLGFHAEQIQRALIRAQDLLRTGVNQPGRIWHGMQQVAPMRLRVRAGFLSHAASSWAGQSRGASAGSKK